MKTGNTIYRRLIVPLGGTLLAAMLAAWTIAVLLLTDAMNQRLDEQLANATMTLVQGQFPFSPELIGRLDQLIEARIALLDAEGGVGMSTAAGQGEEALAALSADPGRFRGQSLTMLSVDAGGEGWRIAVRPIGSARDSRFQYVAAAASLAQTRAVARNAAALLGAAMLFATLVLAWFAHYFSRGITGPIGKLADMANRIAEGERDVASEFDANDEIGVLGRALDDMARRLTEYEGELARRSRLAGLGDLAARMAHEIRNPLTALKMHLQLLEESVPGAEAGRVARLLDEIRRMEMIVESALTLGAPLTLQAGTVNVGRLIEELAELLRPELAHRGIDLRTRTGYAPDIEADADRLRQVLLNLINNAAEALGDDGSILVGTDAAESASGVVITVEDSGPGMPAEGGVPRKAFGLGIGLTICREILAMHGGELAEGESANLGGAQFTIRLPVPIIGTPESAN